MALRGQGNCLLSNILSEAPKQLVRNLNRFLTEGVEQSTGEPRKDGPRAFGMRRGSEQAFSGDEAHSNGVVSQKRCGIVAKMTFQGPADMESAG